jgi:peptidoglycan/LPS O-acetylase OafA/YrhL
LPLLQEVRPRLHLRYFIIMSNSHDFGDGRAAPHDPYIPALDGLRGLAATLVAGAHYMTFETGAPLMARYDTPWSRLFWRGIPVQLGQVSYSMYAVIERPARTWLRALLAPRRAAVLTAPDS